MSSASGLSARFPPDVDPSWLAVPVGLLAAGAVSLYAPVATEMATMLAITLFCVSLWIGSPVEPWFTGVVCLGLVGVAFSTDLALVGFRSPATWLVLFGVLLGEATRRSGLARLVEAYVLRVTPDAATTDARVAYRYMLGTLSVAALGLVVLIPSSLVRVLVLGPMLISIGERFTERRPRVGLFLGPLFVTYYAGTGVLTGSLANIIISGLVETNAGISFGWVQWAAWLGPVMGVGRTISIALIAYLLYRPRDASAIASSGDSDDPVQGRSESAPADTGDDSTGFDESTETSADQRRMFAFLLVGVAVWATDTLHGLHPLYGALLVTLLAFAPRIGVVGPDAVADADFSIVFFLGAIFAIAEGLQRTDFTDLAARRILSLLPADAPLVVVLAFVVLAAMSLAFLMEGLAVASVLTPVLTSFATSAGVPLAPVAMTEAIALNTYFFPYQSAVLVGILSLDVVDTWELIRMATLCSLATLLVLLPLQFAIFSVGF